MSRRVLTRVDVEAARAAGVLELGPRDVLTAAARELAERLGLQLKVAGAGELPAPAPTPAPEPPPRPERAVVTLVGRNRPFILSEISTRVSELGGNIEDISQRILGEYFSTILMVDLTNVEQFGSFKTQVEALTREGDYKVVVQHERLFTAMHRI